MHFWRVTLIFIFLLAGCSARIPEPIDYPYSQQQKMQSSHHWEVLAKDLANRINNQLIITDNIQSAVYVEPTCGDESTPCPPNMTSSFNEAFRDLLITHLFDYGIPTRNQMKEDTITIQYKVQIVRHNKDRFRSLQPGVLTAISSAIVVLRNAPSNLVLLASGVAADIANTTFTANGHYEIIITTSMVKDEKYLFRASDIYYINDEDFYHYQESGGLQTKIIPLSGPARQKKQKPASPENNAN
jgi:hypothetical protein